MGHNSILFKGANEETNEFHDQVICIQHLNLTLFYKPITYPNVSLRAQYFSYLVGHETSIIHTKGERHICIKTPFFFIIPIAFIDR